MKLRGEGGSLGPVSARTGVFGNGMCGGRAEQGVAGA